LLAQQVAKFALDKYKTQSDQGLKEKLIENEPKERYSINAVKVSEEIR
jgi:hypothetical protein